MNPVLRKDLLAILRTPRIAAVQIAFVSILTLLVLASWPQRGFVPLASQGRDDLLIGLILGQIVLLGLFVPGVAAVALTSERENNTLEMLYTSRLTPTQIITGKVASVLGLPVILLISAVPFVALLGSRGDLNLSQLAWSYLILLTSAILLAMLSLMVSALCEQGMTALVLSYSIALVVCGLVLVPAAIMLETQAGLGAAMLHYGRAISPVAAALSVLRPEPGDYGGVRHGLASSSQIFLLLAWLGIAASFAAVALRLRRPPTSERREGDLAGAGGERSRLRGMLYLIDDKRPRRPLGSWNPLVGKERRTNQLRGTRWMVRTFYATLLLALGLAAMSLYGGTIYADLLMYVAQVMVVLQIGVVALVTPSLTSGSISDEIEGGTFELLRMTPLRPGQIFWGKFLPAFAPAFLPVVALAPAYLAICYISPAFVLSIGRVLPVVVLAVTLCCTIGLLCSSWYASTARATVSAYVVVAAIFVVPLVPWWAGGRLLHDATARQLALASPLSAALDALAAATPQWHTLWLNHLLLMAGLCLALTVMARARLAWLFRKG